jgi:hypothetical protein
LTAGLASRMLSVIDLSRRGRKSKIKFDPWKEKSKYDRCNEKSKCDPCKEPI